MAPSLTDGPPGLEGLHTLTPPSPFSSFTFNDWMDPDTGLTRQWTNQAAFSSLTEVQGIHGAPDMDDPRVNLVYQIGETPQPRLPRGKTLTYGGYVAGQTLSAMRNYITAIRSTYLSGLINPAQWTLVATYDPTYDDSGLEFTAYALPVPDGFDCDDVQGSGVQVPSPYRRDFTLSMRMNDPRWWVTTDDQLCSVGTSDDPIDDGTSGTLTMTGTAPSEPTFTVYGTGDGEATIVIACSTLSAQLQFNLLAAMSSGDTLVVNFLERSVTYTHGDTSTDYSGYIDLNESNWWNEADVAATLLVGDNAVSVTGDKWSVTAVPAVW